MICAESLLFLLFFSVLLFTFLPATKIRLKAKIFAREVSGSQLQVILLLFAGSAISQIASCTVDFTPIQSERPLKSK